MFIGDERTDSSKSTAHKEHYYDRDGWYKMYEKELSHKRKARTEELKLRREELQFLRERLEVDDNDRELQREQTQKQLELLITLLSFLKWGPM